MRILPSAFVNSWLVINRCLFYVAFISNIPLINKFLLFGNILPLCKSGCRAWWHFGVNWTMEHADDENDREWWIFAAYIATHYCLLMRIWWPHRGVVGSAAQLSSPVY